ncbi:MAG TPA: alanine--tRNA ligase-related protein [Streptosporangiaceae bacterium]|nr:alanine--tRNA ligase-related protein [Streptosporangiaceae bacterium]
MNADETTRTFLGFFEERGHRVIEGGSLMPPGDGPVLFTTSGMHPLTPYLDGLPHPRGPRLASVQRCLRTTDLDEVGDERHLTVFQMLGSWSLGDYDGPQSLRWGYELITKIFGTERGRLHATVFGGDEQVGPDIQAQRTWEELGVPVEFTTEDNWWSNGPTGPCGPDSELFVWTGDGPPLGSPGTDERWMELWNHVTMRFRRHGDGSLEPLPHHNVDTGMGLERLLMITQGVPSVFGTDVFRPWRQTLPGLWQPDEPSLRLIADHLRASIVIIGDGVRPSSSGRGYVLRRLLRRVLTTLWRADNSKKPVGLPTLADVPAALLEHTLAQFGQDTDPEVIRAVLRDEERRFWDLMIRGRKVLARFESGRPLTPEDLSYLHQTHGLPPDLVTEILTGPGETSRGMLGQ